MNTAIELAERGVIPDALLKKGIVHLLKQRLKIEEKAFAGSRHEKVARFAAELRKGPIAVETSSANKQHYEVPAAFFSLILGPRMKYSSCYWEQDTATLEEAEDKALALTCANAGIEDGMEVLDLGCGWGSLSLWIAEHYPNCRVTAVSNSRSQGEYIRSRAEGLGLHGVSAVTADINRFKPDKTFDRVVSVEAFEHMRNYEELLRRIETWLNDDGKLYVHIFCHRELPYLFEADGESDWMARHFFTGGIMPSEDLLLEFQEHLQLENRWTWNGRHYARTLRTWLAKLDRQAGQARAVLSEAGGEKDAKRAFHRWRIFLHACAELFAFNDGNEWRVSHYLFSKRGR